MSLGLAHGSLGLWAKSSWGKSPSGAANGPDSRAFAVFLSQDWQDWTPLSRRGVSGSMHGLQSWPPGWRGHRVCGDPLRSVTMALYPGAATRRSRSRLLSLSLSEIRKPPTTITTTTTTTTTAANGLRIVASLREGLHLDRCMHLSRWFLDPHHAQSRDSTMIAALPW